MTAVIKKHVFVHVISEQCLVTASRVCTIARILFILISHKKMFVKAVVY